MAESRSSRSVTPLHRMPHSRESSRFSCSCITDCGARASRCGVLWSRSTSQPSARKAMCEGICCGKPSSRSRMRVQRSRFFSSCQVSSEIRPGPGRLAPHRLAALQAVALRARAGHLRIAREDPAEQVGRQQAADDLEGAELGHAAPPGRYT